MTDLKALRARISELERHDIQKAPEPVRARAAFDLQALKELLELRKELEGDYDGS